MHPDWPSRRGIASLDQKAEARVVLGARRMFELRIMNDVPDSNIHRM